MGRWAWAWAALVVGTGLFVPSLAGKAGESGMAKSVVAGKLFADDFGEPALWHATEHADDEVAAAPAVSLESDSAVLQDGRATARMRYRFASKRHDAIMATRRDLEIRNARVLRVTVAGDSPQLELFVVVEERSGERHLLRPVVPLTESGFRTVSFDLAPLRAAPPRHAVGPDHWGGDGNQVLDDPIVAITVGVHDRPDTWMGSGVVHLSRVEVEP